jgi:hypothetical protein
MDFEEFFTGINFRFIKPETFLPDKFNLVDNIFKKTFNFSIEAYITQFPIEDSYIKSEFKELCKIPKMSTLALGAIINYGVKQLPSDQVFVNIGVWNGFTFLSGLLNNPNKICIGVDNFSEFGGPRGDFLKRFDRLKSKNHFFYDLDYNEYFKDYHKGKIGFYIYDGEHSYDNQLKGLQIAEPYLEKNSIILVDDTNWGYPRQATLDFMEKSKEDYDIIFDVVTHSTVHPTFWNGVMILRKK